MRRKITQSYHNPLQKKERFSGRFKNFIFDKRLLVEIVFEERYRHRLDLKTQQLIKTAVRHRLDKKEIVELLVSIGYSHGDATHHVKAFFKKRDSSNQTRLK